MTIYRYVIYTLPGELIIRASVHSESESEDGGDSEGDDLSRADKVHHYGDHLTVQMK